MTRVRSSRAAAGNWRYGEALTAVPLQPWALACQRSEPVLELRRVASQVVPATSELPRLLCRFRLRSPGEPFSDLLRQSCPPRSREREPSRRRQSPQPRAYGTQTPVRNSRPDRTTPATPLGARPEPPNTETRSYRSL